MCCVGVRELAGDSCKLLASNVSLGKRLQTLCVMPVSFTHAQRTHARVHACSNASEIDCTSITSTCIIILYPVATLLLRAILAIILLH